MNKLTTLKLTTITASVALLLSVAFSGSAFAGPGNKKGPQASLGVTAVCFVDVANDELDIRITLEDKSSGIASAELGSVAVQGEWKKKGATWYDIADAVFEDGDPDDDTNNPTQVGLGTTWVSVPICALPMAAKAINALTTVTLNGQASKEEYTSRCKDDPETLYVNEAAIKVADYPNLCL